MSEFKNPLERYRFWKDVYPQLRKVSFKEYKQLIKKAIEDYYNFLRRLGEYYNSR